MKPLEVSRVIILDENNDLVLVRRCNSSVGNGQWELPGGKREDNQTLTSAAIDESAQEAGLTILPLTAPEQVEEREITDGKYCGRIYRASCLIARAVGGHVKTQSDETDDAIVVSYPEALDLDLRPQSRIALEKMAGPLVRACLAS